MSEFQERTARLWKSLRQALGRNKFCLNVTFD